MRSTGRPIDRVSTRERERERSMMKAIRDVLVLFLLSLLSKVGANSRWSKQPPIIISGEGAGSYGYGYCLSWRVGVESNNIRGWRTVPKECLRHIETYMTGGQYESELNMIVDQIIIGYINGIVLRNDGYDAWILDVDDTCISNLFYYTLKQFGCEPYDPQGFKLWASTGGCPAIPAALRLFNKLVQAGFKVILITGRDEQTMAQPTTLNLHNQGFTAYERLILRSEANKGQSAVMYKSEVRKQLVGEGYRIWGNVGDQWSDLQGDCIGNRTFKFPNPMYFVP